MIEKGTTFKERQNWTIPVVALLAAISLHGEFIPTLLDCSPGKGPRNNSITLAIPDGDY